MCKPTPVFTRDECLEGIQALYLEFCDLTCKAEGLSAFRLPDYEAMIEQLRTQGLLKPPCDPAPLRPGVEGTADDSRCAATNAGVVRVD